MPILIPNNMDHTEKGEFMNNSKQGDHVSLKAQPQEDNSLEFYKERLVKLELRIAQLEASETRYRCLFESAKDGILILDAVTGRIVDVNPFLIHLTGFSRSDFLSKHVWEIGPFKDIVASQATFAELQTKEYIRYEELPLETCDGRKIDVEFVSNVYRVDHQKVIQCNIRDITERKRFQDALRESEARFRLSFEHASIGKSLTRVDGRLAKVNQSLCDLLGYSPEELKTKVFADITHPDDLAASRECVRCLLAGERLNYRMEKRYICKDGHIIWTDVSTVLIRNEAGTPLNFITHVIDITNRKQAELEITRTAREWQITFDSSNDAIFILDQNQKILRWNKTAANFFHSATKDFIGQHCWEIVHGTDQPIPECPVFRVQKSLRRETMELSVGKKWFEVNVDPILNAAGELVGAVHMVSDISERKQAEKLMSLRLTLLEFAATHSLDELLRQTLDQVGEMTHSPIGFYHFVDDDQKRLTLQAWSTRTTKDFCTATGQGLHYGIDQAGVWVDCVHQKKPVIHNDYAALSHKKGLPEGHALVSRELVVPIMRGDKIVAILGVGNKPTDYTKQDVETVSYLADVAWEIAERKRAEEEKKKLEDQLGQSQKMESIGQLAGGVAHDFNNLLQGILGFSEIMQSEIDPNDPLSRYVEEIIKAAENAAALTSQLLTFSRKQIIVLKVINLNTIVKRSQTMLARLIGEDLELKCILAEDLWPTKADPAQIDQILVNLAVNSRDAMPDGGKLTIETANVTMDEEFCQNHVGARPGEFIMLMVSDTGCGMAKEVLDKIFEPFFTTKEQGKGTGLGLSMVYGIVKQHEGFVFVSSEPRRGTTFTVYLPRATEIEVAEAPVEKFGHRPLGGAETVLLVEDQDTVRHLARTILKQHAYRVLEAENGGEAFLMCEKYEGAIHLLLTDVVMPKMNGPELYRRLAQMRPEIKVLYMSGYADNALGQRGLLAPGMFFLAKPFKADELLRKVREVLDAKLPAPLSSTAGTILLVDDEEGIRLLVALFLGDENYDVLAAENGQDGLQVFREGADRIDLVLLDQTLPDLDGLEVFRQLRELREDVPIIIVSGFGSSDFLQIQERDKRVLFLPKPFTRRDLLAAVQKALSKSRNDSR
jgi:PAS domain S-box-containing protein